MNYHGPYRLGEQLSQLHFKLNTITNEPTHRTVNVRRLKPYFDALDWKPNFPIGNEITADEEILDEIEENGPIHGGSENIREEDDIEKSNAHSNTRKKGSRENESTGKQIPAKTREKHFQGSKIADASSSTDLPIDNELLTSELPSTPPGGNSPNKSNRNQQQEKNEHNSQTPPANDIFMAEYIIKHRRNKGKTQYLIKWEGFDEKDATWEDASSILDPALLENYIKAPEISKIKRKQ